MIFYNYIRVLATWSPTRSFSLRDIEISVVLFESEIKKMDLLGNILDRMETPPEVEDRRRTKEMEETWAKRNEMMAKMEAQRKEEEKKKRQEAALAALAAATEREKQKKQALMGGNAATQDGADAACYANYNFGTYTGGYAGDQDPVRSALQRMKAGEVPVPPFPPPSLIQGQVQTNPVADSTLMPPPPPPFPLATPTGGEKSVIDYANPMEQFKEHLKTQKVQQQSFVPSKENNGILWTNFDKPPPGFITPSFLSVPPPSLPSFPGQGLGYTPALPDLSDPANSVPVLAGTSTDGLIIVNPDKKEESFSEDIDLDEDGKEKEPKKVPALLDLTINLPRKVPMHLPWRWQQEGRGVCIPPPLDMDLQSLPASESTGKRSRPKREKKRETKDETGDGSADGSNANDEEDMEVCEVEDGNIECAEGVEYEKPDEAKLDSKAEQSKSGEKDSEVMETNEAEKRGEQSGNQDTKSDSKAEKSENKRAKSKKGIGLKGEKQCALDEQKALMDRLFSGEADAGVETVEVEVRVPVYARQKTKKDFMLDDQRKYMEQLFRGEVSPEEPFVMLAEKKRHEIRYRDASQVRKLQDQPMNLEEQMLALKKQQVMLTLDDGQEPPSMLDVIKYQNDHSDMVQTMKQGFYEKNAPEEKKEKREKWNTDKQGHMPMDQLTRKVKAMMHILRTQPHRSSVIDTINCASKSEEVKLDIYRVYQRIEFGGKKRFKCMMYLDNLKVAEAWGNQKKHARHQVYKVALAHLKEEDVQKLVQKNKRGLPSAADMQKNGMELECPGQGLTRESNAGSIPNHPINKGWSIRKPLEDFVLYRKQELNVDLGEGPAAILKQSADFSHCLLEFEYEVEKVAPPVGPSLVPKKPKLDEMPPPPQPPPQMYNTPIWHQWVHDKAEWEKKWHEMSAAYKKYEKEFPWHAEQEKLKARERHRQMQEAGMTGWQDFKWKRAADGGSSQSSYAPTSKWGYQQTPQQPVTSTVPPPPEFVNMYKCTCYIEGRKMGYAENLVKAHAKQKACFEALEYLYKNNWTIMIKSTNPNDLCVLRRSDVLNWVPTMPQSVPADGARSGSSAAMNMMAKMGWTGGGLGSSENKGLPSAIEVAPSNTFSKRGVGNTIYDRVSSDLISKLEELLEFYAQCNTIDEIVFPGIEFSAEEKKAVIQIGQKYGLKTCGTEYNKMNYVLVGRKFTGSDLVKFLELHGNCSNKYMLVKPDTFQVEMNIP